jgi:hypothetical protein
MRVPECLYISPLFHYESLLGRSFILMVGGDNVFVELKPVMGPFSTLR